MRIVRLAAAVATALTLAATPAVAGFYEAAPVFYGIPPFVPVPPIGYVFDPSDPGAPAYIVNQGPVLEGPGIYARHEIAYPTVLDGGYAVVTRHAYPTPFPYVHHVPDVRVLPRRPGIAPYAASVYWPAPRARIHRAR